MRRLSSTYRLQLNQYFNLKDVLHWVPHFNGLGFSHLYLSPITKAKPGSTHGYDVTDYQVLNPELGTENDLGILAEALHQKDMGIILDFVPNHMCIDDPFNRWWADVKEKGRKSKYAHYFDIFWGEEKLSVRHRRFFDINHLVGVRVEEPEVFREVHRKVFEWIDLGWIDGLRIDHIDGLYNPEQYLQNLKNSIHKPFYCFVEKILAKHEKLPSNWGVDGTTGYEFLNLINSLYIDPQGFRKIVSFYEDFTGRRYDPKKVVEQSKRDVIEQSFQDEIARLENNYNRQEIIDQLAEMEVYRTYAQTENNLEMYFQQVSGAIMAKGFEDTACYRLFPLASMNEVGGSLEPSSDPVHDFHQANRDRLQHWPLNLLASSTHDTKRSEDVRCRINVLSEIPEKWIEAVREWEKITQGNSLNQNDLYLLYQSLVGTWEGTATSEYTERIIHYMVKAVREGKETSNWINPNHAYENTLTEYIKRILNLESFTSSLSRLVNLISEPAKWMSLSQLLLKCLSPGTPDIYQGNETWTYRLVDPDNRNLIHFKEIDQQPSLKKDVTQTLLNFRKQHADLMQYGSYEEIDFPDWIGFKRSWQKEEVIVLSKRFFIKKSEPLNFQINREQYHNIFDPEYPFALWIKK